MHGIGVADVLVESCHVRRQRRSACWQGIRNWVCEPVGGRTRPSSKEQVKEVEVEALLIIASQSKRRAGQHRTVEHAEAAAQNGFSSAERIPRETNTRSKVVSIWIVERFALRCECKCGNVEVADQFSLQNGVVFIPQAKI